MKKIKILLIVVAAGFISCENYLDINDSPNNPNQSNVTPDLALSAAIAQPYRTFITTGNELGNVWMNNWAGNVNNITGAFSLEYSLQLNSSFRETIWNNIYLNTANLQNIVDYPSENYGNHKAVAKIMKTFYFQYMVDLYGDIPYSEAHNASILFPAYDDDQAVYRDLYMQLDEAIMLINDSDPVTTIDMGAEDPVFNGDMTEWVKFANTLKLRLLIRESELAESNGESSAYLNEKFAELSTATFITSDVTINPGYNNGSDNTLNPYYLRYGFLSNGTTEGAGQGLVRATDHAIDFLDGDLTGVADPRLTRLYAPAPDGSYTGVRQGETENVPGNLSKIGPGLVMSADQDGWVMTMAEALFLQAEAVQRGYLAGNAQALFEDGIRASFVTLGLTTGVANTYIANSGSVDKIGWNGSANKIEAIMTQKWIALNGINGLESYIEYTRTGFPETMLATIASSPTGDLPKRLFYPTSEYTGNAANVPALTLAQIFTQGPFWYVP